MERVRKGLDLFGREGEVYERVLGNGDLPGYVRGEFEGRGGRRGRDGGDGDGDGNGYPSWWYTYMHIYLIVIR